MLVNLQDKIYKIRKSKLAPETWQKLCDWRADLAERFLVLWASTRKDARWTAAGFLELGVISSARTGRTLYTPGEYKRAIVVETRNATGQGIRTPRQVMIGISIAQRKGLTKRLTLQQRKTLKRSGALKRQVPAARSQRIAATSQSSAAQSQTVTHALSSCGSDYEFFEQFNYFSDARLFDTHTHTYTFTHAYQHIRIHMYTRRKLAEKQTHWSLALDATDVSFSKWMTAVIDFPVPGVSFWAPPMDAWRDHPTAFSTFFCEVLKTALSEQLFFLPATAVFLVVTPLTFISTSCVA
jgi:hypothetical protein